MAYDLSFLDNVTSPVSVYDGVNTASGGIIGIFLLFLLYVGLFVMLRNEDFPKRFLTTNVVVGILAALLWFAEFIAWQALIPIIVLLVVSIFTYFFMN